MVKVLFLRHFKQFFFFLSFGYLAWNSKLCLMPKLLHFLIRNRAFSGRPTLNSARRPPACLQEPRRRALINSTLVPSGRAQIAPAAKARAALPLAAQLGLCVHEPEDPPGVTAASELLCPPVPDTAVRAEGVGLRGAGSQGPSRKAPSPRGACLPVSLGNGRCERGRGSGRPRGSGARRGLPCGPVGTSPLDYLRSALRPQPRPRPEGAPPGRRLGPRFAPEVLADAGADPAVPGLLPPGAPHLERR